MAGKPKNGIDYAGWSVNIFDNDTKIDKLLDAHGWIGFSIYFYLCLRASGGDGYYYKWCFDDSASTARKMGCGLRAGTVRETVGYCLQIGLFDKRLFDRWGVLTSKGIQRSYWAVLKTRRSKTVFRELWLLDDSECEGLVFVPLNKDVQAINNYLQTSNTDMSATNSSVVECSVPNDKNTMCKADALALFERLWQQYPNKKGKGQVSNTQKMKLRQIGFDEMSRAIERYKTELEKDKDWRKPQNGSTFFNSGYVDYLDANYVPGQKQESKGKDSGNSFNHFPQNNYDFDALEKALLEEKRHE